MRKFSHFLAAIVILIIAVNWIGLPYQVRFNSPYLNYWAFSALCLLLPVSLVVSAMHAEKKLIKVFCFTLSMVVVFPAFFLALFSGLEGKVAMDEGVDSSLVLIDEASSSRGFFRLYVTNCGATCSYGLLLRREIDTPVGIKFVQHEWSMYKEREASLEVGAGIVKVVKEDRILYKSGE